ncbi:transglutaminase-like domain-containing protein [Seleniivibrio sp.]|uniref:transglutaminase-like domain-containing protein n=1 Tax=Seleniivibrio sp. TaxID=2898801 RepID=UPI0025EB513F|nr:transglutaminase-like domain-containing protein [Seleniivibrio sp.]MCD8553168.1 transglutaminase-like domain-containing protein [Seleniivibrio sp.]
MKFKIVSFIIFLLMMYVAFFPDHYVAFLNNSSALKKVVKEEHPPVLTVTETETQPENGKSSLKSFLKTTDRSSPFYEYSSKVYKDDPALEALVANITASCGDDTYCKVQKIFEYVRGNVPYVGEPNGVNNILPPYETLGKGGDCEDLSILLASMLNSVNGVKPYLIAVPKHMYVMACGLNGGHVFEPVYNVVYDKATQVSDNKYMLMELGKNSRVRIIAQSNQRFGIMVFPSKLDQKRHMEKKPSTYYPDCSADDVTVFSKECAFPSNGAVLMLSGKGDADVKVQIESVHAPNVRQYEFDKMPCIMLDPSYRGSGADIGEEMPKFVHAKKEVVRAW